MSEQTTPDDTAKNPPLQPAQPASELTASELHGLAPLGPDELKRAAEAALDHDLLGQERALDAIRLAIGIDAPGYNVFTSGLRSRTERDQIVRLLEARAKTMPTPGDWVYVNNFTSPETPVAMYLKPGQGRELREQMRDLVTNLREQLPKAFRQEDFDQERTALKEKYNQRVQELFGKLEARARELSFVIRGGPGGQLLFIPMVDGKPPESPEELSREMAKKSDEERARLAQLQGELQNELGGLLVRQQELMRDLVEEIRAVEAGFAKRRIAPAIAAIDQRFGNPEVSRYLEQVADHMLNHLDRFREQPEGMPMMPGVEEGASFFEYQVNVLVDNFGRSGAPVISEDAPTYRNLFGTIERWVDPLGRAGTNFTRIISGSFLKAHGGFLVFDLEDAIIEPGVWKTLKRGLKTGRMTPETFEPFPFFATGLKPEPIDIRNKIIALGGPYLYNLLYFYDPDFAELFKVKAEIRPVMNADSDAVRHYAARVAAVARNENLPPFDGGALARIVEFGMRMAGDRSRVVTSLEPIEDLAREAAYFARGENSDAVGSRHVERALNERVLRLNFIEEEIRRLIAERVLVVELEGTRVGQINGLAVLDVGGYAFGRPSRLTATVSVGQAGLINIEREAHLSGSTYDKGVMILSGFFRDRFGQQHPLAMTASIGFEQSYSGIDGDSASSTELYALLSALSGVPIRQDLAVTGSVDQHGRVQAIGGANEKIEGFYRLCKVTGLTGKHGVLLPRANVMHLMLDEDVVSAVEKGLFHIYPIDTIDQGIELLTGVRAGKIGEPGTINDLVDRRLEQMARALGRRDTHETRVLHEAVQPAAPPKPPSPPVPQMESHGDKNRRRVDSGDES
ncbi:MAG: AAA family ATPase [Candidatus Binataceae bacterium]|jgi:predicted ATP-dependent protease